MSFANQGIFKFLKRSMLKLAGLWFLMSQSQHAEAATTPTLDCSNNADPYFRLRAMGTFNHLASHGCQSLEDNLVEVSNRNLLYGVSTIQEIKIANNRAVGTDVAFTDEGAQLTAYEIKGLAQRLNTQPDMTQVYLGVMGSNGEYCKSEYKVKC